jgi:predicted MPP superfamily phosphohydrolase
MHRIKRKAKKMIDHTRHIKGVTFGKMGFCTSSAVCKKGTGREWIEVVNIDMRLKNLPEKLVGKRIVQISDIHCGRTVSNGYLKRCIDRVNSLDPDIVVMTGDYVTHDISGKFRQNAVELIGKIKSQHGVYACLGNHDYGVAASATGKQNDVHLNGMVSAMRDKGVNILQNESAIANIEGQPLWMVGLGDLWVGDLDPEKAFAKVPCNEAVIALVHNPDGIDHLHAFPADAVMSGHTHGTTVDLSFSVKKAFRNRRFHAGMFEVDGKKLYVNRGLGRLGRTLFNARPEITVMTLTR